MTTPVCVRQRIRQLDRQGLTHKEISRRLGVSRTTVARYANHGDYSPRPSSDTRPGRSLVDDGYAAIVDGWPAAGSRMPVKQRHTVDWLQCIRQSDEGRTTWDWRPTMADPRHPRHCDEAFKRQIVQLCESGKTIPVFCFNFS